MQNEHMNDVETIFFSQPLIGQKDGQTYTKVKRSTLDDITTVYLLQEGQSPAEATVYNSLHAHSNDDGYTVYIASELPPEQRAIPEKVPMSATWWNRVGVYMDLEDKMNITVWFLEQGFPVWVDQETHLALQNGVRNGICIPTGDIDGVYHPDVALCLLLSNNV